MTTAEKIKQLRLQKGLSQEALGAKIGVKKAAINKYETGRVVNIKRTTLKRLADALGVTPADLLDDESSSSGSDQTDTLFIEKYGQDAYDLIVKYSSLNEREKGKAEGYIDVLLEGRKEDPQRDEERMRRYSEILAPSGTYRYTEEPMMAAESTEENKAK